MLSLAGAKGSPECPWQVCGTSSPHHSIISCIFSGGIESVASYTHTGQWFSVPSRNTGLTLSTGKKKIYQIMPLSSTLGHSCSHNGFVLPHSCTPVLPLDAFSCTFTTWSHHISWQPSVCHCRERSTPAFQHLQRRAAWQSIDTNPAHFEALTNNHKVQHPMHHHLYLYFLPIFIKNFLSVSPSLAHRISATALCSSLKSQALAKWESIMNNSNRVNYFQFWVSSRLKHI